MTFYRWIFHASMPFLFHVLRLYLLKQKRCTQVPQEYIRLHLHLYQPIFTIFVFFVNVRHFPLYHVGFNCTHHAKCLVHQLYITRQLKDRHKHIILTVESNYIIFIMVCIDTRRTVSVIERSA